MVNASQAGARVDQGHGRVPLFLLALGGEVVDLADEHVSTLPVLVFEILTQFDADLGVAIDEDDQREKEARDAEP